MFFYYRFAFILTGLLIASTAIASFQKSPNDHREYLAFTLDNQIQVLVISDPETTQAAASLAVRIGAADDPHDRAGLAHYLEHMLFLGTEKYPELDGYRSFIRQNGGSSNASTGIDFTNYNFNIDAGHLKPALDRFAQFFIAPLFPEAQIDRERSVVDAEYQMRTQRDAIRRWSALRQAYNPKHPSSRFASGTLETLAGDIRSELIDFYHANYSANLMSLVVLGQESPEQLQNWVREIFSEIRNNELPERVIDEPLFAVNTLPALLRVKSLKNEPRLTLLFPVGDLQQHWREKPASYISHLLGHEGEGSLLSKLKDEGWALGLLASSANSGLVTHTLSVNVELTESGLKNWRNVAAYILQYVREIRQRGIEQWRFEENQKLSEIEFRFLEIDDPASAVTYLATELHKFPPDELLTAIYLVENYDPQLIHNVLELVNPENMLAILSSPNLETDNTTPYLQTEYSITSLPEAQIDEWRQDFADASDWLPQRNQFLPENIDLIEGKGNAIPQQISSSLGLKLWHQTDSSFGVPRSSFFVSVRSPITKSSAKNSMLLSLFTDAINDQLTEFVYPALIAGLEYRLYPHSRGFSFRISGFNDKQNLLLSKIVSTLRSPQFDAEKFEVHRRELIREINNRRKDSAYRQTINEFYTVLLEPSWTDREQLQALEVLKIDDLEQFSKQLLDRINIVVLSHGNTHYQQAQSMGQIVSTLINSDRVVQVEKSKVATLPHTGPFQRSIDIEKDDSAISIYIQGDDRSLQERARFSLLAQMISTPFFSDLRSVQKLGYVVFSHYVPVIEVPGLMLVIQSPDVDPPAMNVAITRFLAEFPKSLATMTEIEFQAHKDGLISRLLQKINTLGEKSELYWTEIDRKNFDFDSRNKVATEVESIRQQDFVEFVQRLLFEGPKGSLAIYGFGNHHQQLSQNPPLEGNIVADVAKFKKSLDYFPSL